MLDFGLCLILPLAIHSRSLIEPERRPRARSTGTRGIEAFPARSQRRSAVTYELGAR
jgi:hypothetical protein